MCDKGVQGDSDSPEIIELDNADDADLIVDDVLNRQRALKKPKVGFINNKVIDEDDDGVGTEQDQRKQQDNWDDSHLFDDDLDIDQETINNNVMKAIERIDSDDVDVDKMIYSDESLHDENDEEKGYVNRCDVCDVTGHDGTVTENTT